MNEALQRIQTQQALTEE